MLDINLGDHTSFAIADRLSELGIPFMFATGYGDSGAPMGFDAPIIRKPYDVTQVAAAVGALLAPG